MIAAQLWNKVDNLSKPVANESSSLI